MTGVGLALTFGFVSIELFVGFAVALSVFHFFCLFLGNTLLATFELFHVRLSPALKFIACVAVANILFVGIFTAFLVAQVNPNDVAAQRQNPWWSAFCWLQPISLPFRWSLQSAA